MPTGYTDSLERSDWDLLKWLTENIPRAFGCLVTLRDHSFDLDKDQIIYYLQKEIDDSYYAKALEKARSNLEIARAKTDVQWAREFEVKCEESQEEYNQRLKENQEKKIKYDEAVLKMKEFKDFATGNLGEEFKGMSEFPLEQLEMVKGEFDSVFDSRLSGKHNGWEDYKYDTIQNLESSIPRYEDELHKEKTRERERMEFYIKWVRAVKQFFGITPFRKIELED
jgi:hypothetical protein